MSDSPTATVKPQQVVSSPARSPSHPDPSNNSNNSSSNSASSDSFVELTFPEDAVSLQDLIDSELALRVSTDTIEADAVEDIPVEIPITKLNLLDLQVPDDPIEPCVDDDHSQSDRPAPIDSQTYDDILDSLRDETLDPPLVAKADPLVDDTSQEFDSPANTLSSSSAETPVVAGSPGKPVAAADVNTLFILAEQQGELTPADILFYNTFNQVQSNGDDFMSSPEAATSAEASPKSAGFDPFATIAVHELESPSVESAPPVAPGDGPLLDFGSSEPAGFVAGSLDEVPEPASPEADLGSPRFEAVSGSPVSEPIADELVATVSELPAAFEANESIADELMAEFEPPVAYEVNRESPDVSVSEGDAFAARPESPACDAADLGSPASDPSASISEKQSPMFEVTPPASELGSPLFEADDAESPLFAPRAPDQADEPFARDAPIPVLPDEAETEETDAADNNRSPSAHKLFDTNYSWCATNPVDLSGTNDRNLCESAAVANAAECDGFQSVGVMSNGLASNGICPTVVIDNGDSDAPSSPEHARSSDNSVNEEKKKKKKSDGGETKTKRTKKTKKEEKENISVKSSFSKFDALSKKTVLHVRSGDASKAQKQFSQASTGDVGSSACRSCGKQVFQMEQVKAERSVWHKNCFRCHDCNKQLTVDIYSSHEGVVYCKPHFKELFKPKAVVEDEAPGSDKPDLGLEELAQLNVKSRFQAFEKAPEEAPALGGVAVSVKRSPSILSKLARFQAGGGGDVGVSDSALNGAPPSSESSSEEEEGEEEGGVVRANRKQRERPVTFAAMEDVKGRWEAGTTRSREERREERKLEISTIRSRLFMGHQGKMKEAYQAAVSESTASAPGKRDVEVGGDRARCIKERFERGQVNEAEDEQAKSEAKAALDEDLVDAGYSKKSRSLFLELDATAAKMPANNNVGRPVQRDESFRNRQNNAPLVARQTSQGEVVRASDAAEEVRVETAEIGSKFQFFETFRPEVVQRRAFRITPPRDGTVKGGSPEREIYRDPTIVRADDPVEETVVLRSQTASKMLSFFKHMEAAEPDKPQGPKPLKRFTPPPDCERNRDDSSSSEGEGESSSEGEDDEADDGHDPNIIRAADKMEDAFLKEAQSAAVRAKTLRAKFERWEEREIEREKEADPATPTADGDTPSLDTTRSLRARFESMSHEVERAADKQPRSKVNRFVEIQTSTAEFCSACDKKVYHLEKVETGGKIFHKNCFRCTQCNCVLRMDTYTLNGGRLYCLPHFKQGFFTRGNYDEGFGADQHKRKWASDKRDTDILLSLTTAADR